jgi:hypothetical protein
MKLGSCGLEQRIYIKGFLIQSALPFLFYHCAGARETIKVLDYLMSYESLL